MKIAVDCDEVVANFVNSFILFHNQTYRTSLRREDFHAFDFKKIIGLTGEEENRRFSEFYATEYFSKMPPVYGSADALRKLKNRGDDLSMVTARPGEILESTRNWVDSHFNGIFSDIVFSSDIFINNRGTKAQICREIGAEIMIDDSPEYSRDIASKGTNVLLYDAPWNRDHVFSENVKRVYSWEDIENYLLK